MCFGMFCTIPLPGYWDEGGAKFMMPWFPVVGAVIGMIWWLAAEMLGVLSLWIPASLIAAFLILIPFLLAGLIHLDGFMDTSDAILSRRGIEDKLRIIKDPNAGAFSVIMTVILFMFLFASGFAIAQKGASLALLIVISAVSRCFSSMAMLCIRPMTDNGYAGLFKPETPMPQIIMTIVFLIAAFWAAWSIGGYLGLIVAAAVAVGYTVAMLIALKSFEFKGVSGDLAGFSLVIAEMCGLVALAIV